jgi:hypothetical protein
MPMTETLYYCARYYDQTTGRFISEDPTGFKAGVNFYRNLGKPGDRRNVFCYRVPWLDWLVWSPWTFRIM